jgi:uncharacterized membrane protein
MPVLPFIAFAAGDAAGTVCGAQQRLLLLLTLWAACCLANMSSLWRTAAAAAHAVFIQAVWLSHRLLVRVGVRYASGFAYSSRRSMPHRVTG